MTEHTKEEAEIDQNVIAYRMKKIRPKTKYVDPTLRDRRPFPYTEEYNCWRDVLVSVAHLLKDKYGDLFDWDKFIDDAKSDI